MSKEIALFVLQLTVPGYDLMPSDEQAAYFEIAHVIVRKLGHFSEFALLGALAANLFARIARPRDPLWFLSLTPMRCCAAWAFSIAYAASDEFHQLFVPGRGCLITDVAIDSTGALIGIAVVAAIAFFLSRRR